MSHIVVDVRKDETMKCGCGGPIESGTGCQAYLGSVNYNFDVGNELMMRSMGAKFGADLDESQTVMSIHLQLHGLHHEDAEEILLGRAGSLIISPTAAATVK